MHAWDIGNGDAGKTITFGDRDDDPFFEDQPDAPSTKEQPSQPWSDRELPSDANTSEDKPVPQDIQQDDRPSTYRRRSGNMRQGQAPSASQEGQGPSGILEDQQAPKEEQQAPKEEQQAPKDTTDSQVTDAGRWWWTPSHSLCRTQSCLAYCFLEQNHSGRTPIVLCSLAFACSAAISLLKHTR